MPSGVYPRKTALEYFFSHVSKIDSGCWEWTGCIMKNGYGKFSRDGKTYLSHRWYYFEIFPETNANLDLDHLCRNRKCVNPAHLEPVTRRENLLRGKTKTAENHSKTKCIRGHEFTPENTYTRPGGSRECKTCIRLRKEF